MTLHRRLLQEVGDVSSSFSIREVSKIQNRNDSFSNYLSGVYGSHLDWRNAADDAVFDG
jgi:phage FluMu protein gp41